MTIIPLRYWLAGVILLWASIHPAKAEPVAAFEQQGVRIVVYTEKCDLGAVSNLPNRATWTENGQTIEGCAQAFPQFGVAAFYFADKSIAIVPLQMFQRVIGA